jgi:hypothetical protein
MRDRRHHLTAVTLRRGEWLVHPIPEHDEAARLIRSWHYAGGTPNTSTYRHGLYAAVGWPLTGEPYGVALWLPPAKPAAVSVAGEAWRGVLTLSRFALDPGVPANGASFLLGRSMRMIDRDRWPILLTYADTSEGHDGAIYRATNWTCLGPVPAGDVWIDAAGRQAGRKRGRFTYTIAQMLALGYERKPAAPKVKYVHIAKGHVLTL